MTMRRWLLMLGCVVGLMVPAATSATASRRDPGLDRIDQFMQRHNMHPELAKLGRGASNFTMGWLEIPLNIHKHKSKRDTVGSFFTGLFTGVARGVGRTGIGLYEMVTCFLPYPDDFAPILPTLDYFQKDTARERLPGE